MNIGLYDFEKSLIKDGNEAPTKCLTDEEINKKYSEGEARIITENGSIKLPLINGMFKSSNYVLRPKYQRRITWNNKKRSKLIESFIMNIPVPPVFLYETEFGVYQVMDGLQRISTIMDFFDNKFSLEDLGEWNELNGRFYKDLPQKIKEGIERRQLNVITLLKESAKTNAQEANMKKMVFERLNTGGEKLEQQEVRNALYPGKFNDMCIELSKYETFRKLWGIKTSEDLDDDKLDDRDIENKSNNKLYIRMYDVELVLRFFAMRNIENYNLQLSKFLDLYLDNANKLSEENLKVLKQKFIESMEKVDTLFGDKAFCKYVKTGSKWSWTRPQKMIFDPMMLAIDDFKIEDEDISIDKNIKILENMYKKYENRDQFNGKKQSKIDIEERTKVFIDVIHEIKSI
jgi:hypothetical protein